LKYPLNGQQEEEVELFIATTQLRRLTLPAVTQLITRRFDVEYVMDEVQLRKASYRSFFLSLSALFLH
jgi:transposase